MQKELEMKNIINNLNNLFQSSCHKEGLVRVAESIIGNWRYRFAGGLYICIHYKFVVLIIFTLIKLYYL